MTERPHGAPLPDVTRADEEKAIQQMGDDIYHWAYIEDIDDLARHLIALGWRRP